MSPLFFAIDQRDTELVRALMDNGAKFLEINDVRNSILLHLVLDADSAEHIIFSN